MKLWDDFLIRMAELKMPVFAISGNHDSAVRFSDHGALVGATGIRLSRVYDGTAESYLLSDGDVNVRIHLLPFLKQDYSIPHIYSAHVIVYNTVRIKCRRNLSPIFGILSTKDG